MTVYYAEDYEVLDDGTYPGTLVEIEDKGEHGDYGPFVTWHFDADGGALGTVRVSERSGVSFRPGTKARLFYEGVLGRALDKGEAVAFDLVAGTPVTLKVSSVVKTKGTFNKIVAVARRRQQQSAPPPAAATAQASFDSLSEAGL